MGFSDGTAFGWSTWTTSRGPVTDNSDGDIAHATTVSTNPPEAGGRALIMQWVAGENGTMHTTPVTTRSKRLLLLVALMVFFAGACGGDDEPAVQQPGAPAHNASDAAFAHGMIPHHEQAIQMSDLALVRASNPKVTELATRIKAAQGPEIEKMKAWLVSWGEPHKVAAPGHGAHAGMLSEAEMGQLSKASGPEFDRLFLEGMIRHHEGAVTMSEEELAKGSFPEAKGLARQIIDSQRAEINEMRGMLGGGQKSAPPAHH